MARPRSAHVAVGTLRQYIAASHPLPTLAVTGFVVALALALGLEPSTVGALAVATLAGQLSIGWSNDLVDAERDARAGRLDKPLAMTQRHTGFVVATTVAVVLCVVVSVTVGALAAACHLTGVACGWAYNLGLKSTLWSWLPYAVAFGLLPTWVIAAQPGSGWAPAWMAVAASTLGVSAHLVNAAPDVADDRRLGVMGVPQRIGASRSLTVAFALLSLGSVIGLMGPAGTPAAWQWALLGCVLACAAAAIVAVWRAQRADGGLPRWTFVVMLALVAVVVALILASLVP